MFKSKGVIYLLDRSGRRSATLRRSKVQDLRQLSLAAQVLAACYLTTCPRRSRCLLHAAADNGGELSRLALTDDFDFDRGTGPGCTYEIYQVGGLADLLTVVSDNDITYLKTACRRRGAWGHLGDERPLGDTQLHRQRCVQRLDLRPERTSGAFHFVAIGVADCLCLNLAAALRETTPVFALAIIVVAARTLSIFAIEPIGVSI